jgi:transposase-like protein
MKTATKQGQGRKPKNQHEALESIKSQAKEIGKYIKLGMTMTDSARAAGVNPRTLYSWLDKAKAGKPGYEEVADLLEHDRAVGQAALAQRIAKASDSDWRAAAWILERRHTETWGRADKLQLSGGIDLNLGKLSDAELDAQLEATEAELKELGE